MYDDPACSCMIDALKPRFTHLCCEGRAPYLRISERQKRIVSGSSAIKYGVAFSFWTNACYMKDMHVFERDVNGLRYRIAAQSVWDPVRGRSVARQIVLGPATAAPVADLSATRTVGTQAVGDVGALIWVAEQLDLIGHIDRACGDLGARGGPSVGELAVAVAIQRACSPGPKRDLAEFLDGAVPRLSCLPSSAFSGQTYHRVARQVTDEQLEQAQIAIANAAVARFELSADVLAFDTTNFDTHIATALVQIVWFKQEQSDLFLSKGPIDGLFTQLLCYESKRKLLFAPEPARETGSMKEFSQRSRPLNQRYERQV